MRHLLLLLALGCARGPAPEAPRSSLYELAAAGISDRALGDLLTDHWTFLMDANPGWATDLGLHDWDGRASDLSVEGARMQGEAIRRFLERARGMDASALSPSDQRYLSIFIDKLEVSVAGEACRRETWSISPRGNVVADLLGTLDVQRLDEPAHGAVMLRRLDAWVASVPAHLDALRTGIREGRVANATSTGLVIEQAQRVLDREHWELLDRAGEGAEWDSWRAQMRERIDGSVGDAIRAYQTFLSDELLPVARGDDNPGLAGLPDGAACYAARIRNYTTLPLKAEDVHHNGLVQLAKIHEEFVAPGAAVFGVWDRSLLFERLRTDPALYFETAEEIVSKAEEALRRAEAAVPSVFGNLPETPCVIAVIPEHEAPYTTIAYYRQPNPDGSKPGEYFVNTYEPTSRPRHEAEVLAFHESVPGHHLQIALSYELPQTPAFHRFDGSTAFVEGWALYTERLADELGLYSSEVDRLGMLSFDAWRASRLVVDTGLHHLGWSRQQAIDFMLENTPLQENNIVNEVDRYITWSGQALAYKTGQLEILELRREAEEQLGDRFDLSGFHDTVLGQGAVSLPLLREQVRTWIAASAAAG